MREGLLGCTMVERCFKSFVTLGLASSGMITESPRDKKYLTEPCDTTNWQQICLVNSRENKDGEHKVEACVMC